LKEKSQTVYGSSGKSARFCRENVIILLRRGGIWGRRPSSFPQRISFYDLLATQWQDALLTGPVLWRKKGSLIQQLHYKLTNNSLGELRDVNAYLSLKEEGGEGDVCCGKKGEGDAAGGGERPACLLEGKQGGGASLPQLSRQWER